MGDNGIANKKEKLIYHAKLAEQSERYEDMVQFMKNFTELGDELSSEERNLLSVAYKNLVTAHRSAWRVISTIVQNTDEESGMKKALAKEYREKLERELCAICNNLLVIGFAFDFETTCRLRGHHRKPRPVLLQISTDSVDYLIDLLAPEVRDNILLLSGPFGDKNILKVVHGHDTMFLRKLGITSYPHLYDTSSGASKALDLLVYEACGVWLDKTLKTSDWTLRPLTQPMIDYARCDTHYLLAVHDHLRRSSTMRTCTLA